MDFIDFNKTPLSLPNIHSVFQKTPILQIQDLNQQTQKAIAEKKQKLRDIVSRRYRNLIDSVDIIADMRTIAESLSVPIEQFTNKISQFTKKNFYSKEQNLIQEEKNQKFLFKSSINKLVNELINVPENIINLLNQNKILNAAKLFKKSSLDYQNLQEKQKSHENIEKISFDFFTQYWDFIQDHFRIIIEKSQSQMKLLNISNSEYSDAISAIVYLKFQEEKNALILFLDNQLSGLETLIEEFKANSKDSEQEKNSKFIKLISSNLFRIISSATTIFSSTQNPDSLYLKLDGDCVVISQTTLKECFEDWLQKCSLKIRDSLLKVLYNNNSLKILGNFISIICQELRIESQKQKQNQKNQKHQTENKYKQGIFSKKKRNEKYSVEEHFMGNLIWNIVFQDLLIKTSQDFLQQILDSLHLSDYVPEVLKKLPIKANQDSEVWQSNRFISQIQKTKSTHMIFENEDNGIVEYSKVILDKGIEIVDKFVESLNDLFVFEKISEIVIQAFQEKTLLLGFKFLAMIQEYFVEKISGMQLKKNSNSNSNSNINSNSISIQDHLQKINHVQEEIFNLLSNNQDVFDFKETDNLICDELTILSRISSILKRIFIGILEKIFIKFLPEKKNQFKKEWKKMDDDFSICIRLGYYVWAKKTMKKHCQELRSKIESDFLDQDEQKFLWKKQMIEGKNDADEQIKETIELPFIPSGYLTTILFHVCKDVIDKGGAFLGDSILKQIFMVFHQELFSIYSDFMNSKIFTENSSENQNLQFGFDIRFLFLLFGLTKENENNENENNENENNENENEIENENENLIENKFFEKIKIIIFGKEEMQSLFSKIETKIDPINWVIYQPFIVSNIEMQAKRSYMLYGILSRFSETMKEIILKKKDQEKKITSSIHYNVVQIKKMNYLNLEQK
ncbi:conserved oligomeric golgi complex subunit 1 [Anaeramoeba ignava]|uniref:Conserved oligomeric Golgi complex subunit 1 n=1 Tax=Anaeramoeba ignava TaxID=1746090 RepID=A0A9Q0LG32_ANAIG|nr:conserved oligomeric golgi complex subunit 1 [Anaeramoeba ignava]